jgi:CO/xanthine dehydrogenase FAD-binding subunit
MIPFDFEYFKPTSIHETCQILQDFNKQGKTAIIYSGGTEFITFSRINKLNADAVIDIKGIPECHVLEFHADHLVIGAAVSINKITESNLFPLLGKTVKQIADHTSRNKISIGGNLNSRLIYREAILPLLLTDAKVKIVGREGEITIPLEEVYDKELKLAVDQFLVQILIKKEYITDTFFHLKRTRLSKVGYPIVSIAALVKDKKIRAAFSGVCEYPFRSTELEASLNNTSIDIEERIEQAIKRLPSPILEDIQASREYREFVLKNALQDTLHALKGATS